MVVEVNGPGSSQNILSTPWFYWLISTDRRALNETHLQQRDFCNKPQRSCEGRIKHKRLRAIDLGCMESEHEQDHEISRLAELSAFTKAFFAASLSTCTSSVCSLSRSTPDVDWISVEDVAAIVGAAQPRVTMCVPGLTCRDMSNQPFFILQCSLAALNLNRNHDGDRASRPRI